MRPATVRATSRSAAAAFESSPAGYWEEVIGTPASPPARTPGSSGMRPRTSSSSSRAIFVATARAEDVVLVAAVGADEAAHVLDHAERADVDLAEHRDRLARVEQAHLLRRRHDHRARQRDELAERERGVAGARRQVDDEVVELAPLHVAQELGDRAVDQRPAPDDRRIAGFRKYWMLIIFTPWLDDRIRRVRRPR